MVVLKFESQRNTVDVLYVLAAGNDEVANDVYPYGQQVSLCIFRVFLLIFGV